MQREVDLLLVSSEPQTQYAVLEILKEMPVRVVTAESADRAKEVLARRAMAIVLCDHHLADGTYQDVLAVTAVCRRKIPLVVMLTSDSSGEYREALDAGACGAVRWPSRAIDVELALIRALRRSVAAMAMGV